MTNTSPRDFSLDQLTVTGDMQPTNSILLRQNTEEIIRVDKEGFHYNGQFIADAGEAHRLLVEFLRQNTKPEPEGPTDDELVAVLKQAIKDFPPNHPDAKALDSLEYDIEIELRKARAALARWGK